MKAKKISVLLLVSAIMAGTLISPVAAEETVESIAENTEAAGSVAEEIVSITEVTAPKYIFLFIGD